LLYLFLFLKYYELYEHAWRAEVGKDQDHDGSRNNQDQDQFLIGERWGSEKKSRPYVM
jgi:hypothetical protein